MGQIENEEWQSFSYKEKNRILFESQKVMLKMLFERGAITQQQYIIGNAHLNNMGKDVRCCAD